MEEEDESLFVKTPLIETLSGPKQCKVFLKLENTQPSGSFKTRGISYHCKKLKERGCHYFVSSSGGNAGLAVAYSGRKLKIPVTVFVPETTPVHVIERLNLEGAKVQVKGSVWDVANKHAENFVQEKINENGALVHPFNHTEIWDGHSSIITELKSQLSEPPSAIVLSVGGGGLLCGVMEGLRKVAWTEVPVIACETEGADCFNAAIDAGELVTLPEISSVAKCLGALTVLPEALAWTKKHHIIPVRVTDKDAVNACLKFADEHKMIVEPACGASLTMLYGDVLKQLLASGTIKSLETVVIIVCGGHAVKMKNLLEWKELFNL